MSESKLKKNISFLEAMAIVVGMIIGSGVFLKPGIVLQNAGTPALAITAWVAGGIITLASALTIAEIAAAIPKSGGLYTYLKDLYGDVFGFLLGWVQTIISYPASVAAQAIAFATYTSFFWPISAAQQKIVAICVLGFILLMNVLATKYGGIIQVVATIGKLVPIVAIILFGIINSSSFQITGTDTISGGNGFGVAILGTLWAYEGWISVTNMAGELKKPTRDLPRVISLGVLFVVVVYAIFNLAIFRAIPINEVVTSSVPAADAAIALFGKNGAMFITAGIMVSVFGALNGFLMTGARIPFAMGEEKMLPGSSFLSKVSKKFHTPANALILESVLAVVYILTGTFNTLTDLLVFVLWIFFTMGVFGVFRLRKHMPKKEGLYRVPFYPITPIVGILGGLYILISTVISNPTQSLVGIIITLIGLPVYYFIKRK
ncbi:APC family permease [Clostridium cadaveris]|uniref:Amino acid permease n=1 Tax=Clostridium cadaveris TaxID=1529 RepID=A0A316M205_9CLOT|nr:amino acid permease [Clostridium cadaveris]PWL52532.1 MAG: amino acid permease [Clostridium cadaveris]UFH63630.1 amino acid permease [Clostridium cadaveris]